MRPGDVFIREGHGNDLVLGADGCNSAAGDDNETVEARQVRAEVTDQLIDGLAGNEVVDTARDLRPA
jgi:hypothetical protein